MSIHCVATQKIFTLFTQAGFSIRIVGGFVRDYLLNKPHTDIDFATGANTDDMIAIAKANHIKYVRNCSNGNDYGCIFIIAGQKYDISTLRTDTYDGTNLIIQPVACFESDANRRDFTINSMFMDAQGTIYDYNGGREDLANGIIRFNGDPSKRIAEDHLRILRYFRFASTMNALEHDADILKIISSEQAHKGLSKISIERIWSELKKIFASNGKIDAIDALIATKANCAIGLPSVYDVEKANNSSHPIAVLACFNFAARPEFKLSNHELQQYVFLKKNHNINITSADAFLTCNVDKAAVLLTLEWVGIDAGARATLNNWQILRFSRSGHDIIAKEREIGAKLKQLRIYWENSDYTASKEELLTLK